MKQYFLYILCITNLLYSCQNSTAKPLLSAAPAPADITPKPKIFLNNPAKGIHDINAAEVAPAYTNGPESNDYWYPLMKLTHIIFRETIYDPPGVWQTSKNIPYAVNNDFRERLKSALMLVYISGQRYVQAHGDEPKHKVSVTRQLVYFKFSDGEREEIESVTLPESCAEEKISLNTLPYIQGEKPTFKGLK